MGMLLRSKKYLEMLLGLDALFERGLHCFHHGGTHNYYLCLENLLDMAAINAIEDVASTPDKTWKELLKADARGRDALADEELASFTLLGPEPKWLWTILSHMATVSRTSKRANPNSPLSALSSLSLTRLSLSLT